MTNRRSNPERKQHREPVGRGNANEQVSDLTRLREILDRANASERHGFKFGLFPLWVQDYDLSNAELARLMVMARGEIE